MMMFRARLRTAVRLVAITVRQPLNADYFVR